MDVSLLALWCLVLSLAAGVAALRRNPRGPPDSPLTAAGGAGRMSDVRR